MLRIALIRLASVVPVLFGISVISFFVIRMIPGDVISSIMGQDFGDPQVEAAMRRYFGLDMPIHEQFLNWFGGLLQGDLGTSMRTSRPVLAEIAERFPATLLLAVSALVVSVVISIPFGVLSATRRNGFLDAASRLVSLIGLSLPNFWLGILLVYVFSVTLGWLPSQGSGPGGTIGLAYLVLPAVTLGASLAAISMRMTRSSMLEVLNQDYMRTARAKGLSERVVVARHALRNSLIPVVTVWGIQAGALLGGTVVVEQVFSWPGLGTMVIRGISQRDYPVVQGTLLFLALFYVVVNLFVDLVYVYLDPRLRSGH
ncbi:glutathione ABC transporter permease GsiC [Spongiactinospora gelatinilytica]|uniref:Glutathione transport system permease protein GsiC n=1 Tax=Spongiactinospora gelatinilytica TaxID=2666298 RepID=A0A2W2GEG0_9ACTN|nr:nickel ABC transporter permease [Spongiactinospora gelatinilytica]PZG35298.1 glutathione ABC transporter permease GsiC [Spongiactinospora gelatinilytica]